MYVGPKASFQGKPILHLVKSYDENQILARVPETHEGTDFLRKLIFLGMINLSD